MRCKGKEIKSGSFLSTATGTVLCAVCNGTVSCIPHGMEQKQNLLGLFLCSNGFIWVALTHVFVLSSSFFCWEDRSA